MPSNLNCEERLLNVKKAHVAIRIYIRRAVVRSDNCLTASFYFILFYFALSRFAETILSAQKTKGHLLLSSK
jgi:hypothetical protein